MAETSTIEWTDATWNPVTGCTLVSEGCRHCYAAQLAATRLKNHPTRVGLARLNASGEAKFTGEVRLNPDWIEQPLRWKRPRRIFVCAHGDLFHESVPDEWIDQVFAVMALAPQHTFQVLTKRPERAAAYLKTEPDILRDRWYRAVPAGKWYVSVSEAYAGIHPHASDEIRALHHREAPVWPLPNVWLGTSVEDQATADARIPHLLAAPAAVRFLSVEPLLGPVDLHSDRCRETGSCPSCPACLGGIDWVIVGGESGRQARPMHPDWARALRDQCVAAGVPFFFKQWGEWWPVSQMPDGELDGLYEPAPERHPDASRRCKHETAVLHKDGVLHSRLEPMAFRQGSGAMTLFQVGKKAAGRVLDGRTWDETPGAAG